MCLPVLVVVALCWALSSHRSLCRIGKCEIYRGNLSIGKDFARENFLWCGSTISVDEMRMEVGDK